MLLGSLILVAEASSERGSTSSTPSGTIHYYAYMNLFLGFGSVCELLTSLVLSKRSKLFQNTKDTEIS